MIFQVVYCLIFNAGYFLQKPLIWQLFGYNPGFTMRDTNQDFKPLFIWVYPVSRLLVALLFIAVCLWLKKVIAQENNRSPVIFISVACIIFYIIIKISTIIANIIGQDILNSIIGVSSGGNSRFEDYGAGTGSEMVYIYSVSMQSAASVESVASIFFIISLVLLVCAASILWYKNKYCNENMIFDK